MTFMYDALGVIFGPVMRAIYVLVGNYGLAIILFTVLYRVLMLPSAISQQKSMAKNQRTQIKLRKIQERYKDDRQRQQQEIQEFQQREGVNPMGGCSSGMLLQFVLMFGLIAAIYRPIQYTIRGLADGVLGKLTQAAAEVLGDDRLRATDLRLQLRIVENIDKFKDLIDLKSYEIIRNFADNFRLFGLDLGKAPSDFTENVSVFGGMFTLPKSFPSDGSWIYYIIPLLVGISSIAVSLYTYSRQRKTQPEMKQNAAMMGCMTFGMPLFSVGIVISFPVGIGMYWIIGSVVQLLQTVILTHTHPPQKMLAQLLVEETIVRRSREISRKKIYEMNA